MVVTPDMVGSTVAIFTAVEVKAGTRPTVDQLSFIAAVKGAGGYAGIARTDADLGRTLADYNIQKE